MKDRLANLRRVRRLDPAADHLQIYQLMLRFEFCWDMRVGLNLAFNRSFAVPRIAALLVSTGDLTKRARKRAEETGLLMYEMILNGFADGRGRQALRRLNQIHRPFPIANEDYLYVLAALVVIPTRWLQRHGWRRPCCHERAATHAFYRELGQRMGISDIPDSYEAMERWFDEHDAARLTPNRDAVRIERATRELLLGRIPKPFAPLGDALVRSLYDPRLRAAVMVDRPAWPVRAGLHAGLKARAWTLRWLARPRRTAMFANGIVTRTYPNGYDIGHLGPETAASSTPTPSEDT